jgi:hypothetical protein
LCFCSSAQRWAIFGWLAHMKRRCFSLWNGMARG